MRPSELIEHISILHIVMVMQANLKNRCSPKEVILFVFRSLGQPHVITRCLGAPYEVMHKFEILLEYIIQIGDVIILFMRNLYYFQYYGKVSILDPTAC